MKIALNFNSIGIKGEPLVMLHGWGWHSGIWDSLLVDLSKKFQLFMIDLPGYGKSSLLTISYNSDEIEHEILKIVPEKASWLGWSLGGMLALDIAAKYPERVNHLVTVASSPKFISDSEWPGMSTVTIDKFSNALIDNYENTLIQFLELQLRGGANNVSLFEELKIQLLSTNKTSQIALMGGLEILRNLDLRDSLRGLKCKSLHIFGSHDTLVPAKVASLVQSLSPRAQCEVIKRAGHMPFLSQKQIFLDLIFKFFS